MRELNGQVHSFAIPDCSEVDFSSDSTSIDYSMQVRYIETGGNGLLLKGEKPEGQD